MANGLRVEQGNRSRRLTMSHRRACHAAARALGAGVIGCVVAAASPVVAPAVVHAYGPAAVSSVGGEGAMFGDPTTAARYWREQHASDCAEMAVADVVGEITDRLPTEREVLAVAENTTSAAGPGSIWKPNGFTDIRDIPKLLSHYGIQSDNVQTDIAGLERSLSAGRRVIAIVNAEVIWNRPGKRDVGNHFVVVTGIDTRSATVHLNDSAVRAGRDEQVTAATFEQAWAPNYHSAVITR